MKLLTTAVIASALLPIGHALPAVGIDFKGVELGSTVEQLLVAHPAFYCNSERTYCSISSILSCTSVPYRTPAYTACEAKSEAALTYGGVPVEDIGLSFRNGGLSTVTVRLKPAQYPRITLALQEKYGPATDKKAVELKNRMGATFQGETLEWRRQGVLLRAQMYAGSLDRSRIDILTEAADADRAQQILDSAKKGAKDL